MNLKNGLLNWSKEVKLNNRVERLENRLNPKRIHAFRLENGESELQASERYCTENGLDLDKFENGDYGKIIMIIHEQER